MIFFLAVSSMFSMRDVDMNQTDYDNRTALHIGAAEGHEGVVRFLLENM